MIAATDPLTGLRLPVIVAPMFLVSGVDLVVEACKAGIVGSFPSLNARTADGFAEMLTSIESRLSEYRRNVPGSIVGPYAVNLVVRQNWTDESGSNRSESDLDVVVRHRVPLIVTSVGNPSAVVGAIHDYGGKVYHDVIHLQHARKAAEAGVDGLILVSGGAGGHAGTMNPFAFVAQVRRFFDGDIILAGSIGDGRAVRAAEVLGARFAYMGTRFIATKEAMAPDGYKQMLVAEQTKDIVYTPAFSGVPANYMSASIRAVGMDPANLPKPKGVFDPDLPEGVKAWRDVWSAGHGVGLIDDVPSVAELVDRLEAEYRAAG
jgi:nitronate monooxygenase